MSPPAYDFWLFDLDGTLVDVDPAYPHEVFDRVGERLGHAFTDREVEVLWYGVGGTRDAFLRERGIDPDRFWTVFHEEEDPEARAAASYRYDDAAVVGDLDAPVGVVTHCQRYLAEPVIDRLAIADWFDAVICCTDETGWKPDPEPVRLAMDALGVGDNGHRGALAGDDPYDVGAAWNAGLDAIHVRRAPPERRDRCVLGDYRVERVDELV